MTIEENKNNNTNVLFYHIAEQFVKGDTERRIAQERFDVRRTTRTFGFFLFEKIILYIKFKVLTSTYILIFKKNHLSK